MDENMGVQPLTDEFKTSITKINNEMWARDLKIIFTSVKKMTLAKY